MSSKASAPTQKRQHLTLLELALRPVVHRLQVLSVVVLQLVHRVPLLLRQSTVRRAPRALSQVPLPVVVRKPLRVASLVMR